MTLIEKLEYILSKSSNAAKQQELAMKKGVYINAYDSIIHNIKSAIEEEKCIK